MNGKLPSQDLSAWVGGHTGSTPNGSGKGEWEKLIPPLKEVSPLSLGEIGKEPLHFGKLFRKPCSCKLEYLMWMS